MWVWELNKAIDRRFEPKLKKKIGQPINSKGLAGTKPLFYYEHNGVSIVINYIGP